MAIQVLRTEDTKIRFEMGFYDYKYLARIKNGFTTPHCDVWMLFGARTAGVSRKP